jgi:molybdate transport system ATP-binding protein/molybdate transport system permease protein
VSLEVEIERQLPGFALRAAFAAGEKPVGILGASGAGKTMTMRAVAGLYAPTSGRITLDGRVLFDSTTGVNLPSRARQVGLLFQHHALFPHLTVEENIAFGLRRLDRGERARRVSQQIAAMRLSGLESRYPGQLSGGQQQRVALARALAPEPAALLLDEPFSALDTYLRSQLEHQLHETLAAYRGVKLVVSHNLEEIYRLCDELVVMDQGSVIARGSREEIFRWPPSRQVALVTGCKNFSRAQARDTHCAQALDWGCTLRVAREIPRAIAEVAIRAHHIRVTPGDAARKTLEENTLPCWVAAVSEAPFHVTLYLRLHAAPADSSDYHLQVEITQEHWAELKTEPCPWFAQLDPERLFPLPD